MCIFCEIIKHNIPSKIVYENDKVLAILDVNPVSFGHTLVMPKEHTDSFLTADAETVQACFAAANEVAKLVVDKTGADGCNILTNCNEAAGQTVSHMHIHVIPRKSGDNALIFGECDSSIDTEKVLETITK